MTALNTDRTRPLLSEAAQLLSAMRNQNVVVITRLVSDDKQKAEVEDLKAQVAKLEQKLARRVRLDDATICAGYRRYEQGPETHVLALVGTTFTTARKVQPTLFSRVCAFFGRKE